MEAEEGESLSDKSEGGNERARRSPNTRERDGSTEDRRPQRKGCRERGPEVPKEARKEGRTGGPKGRERGLDDPVGVPVDGVA